MNLSEYETQKGRIDRFDVLNHRLRSLGDIMLAVCEADSTNAAARTYLYRVKEMMLPLLESQKNHIQAEIDSI